MLDDLDQVKKLLTEYLKDIEKYLSEYSELPDMYLSEVLKLKKETRQFINYINGVKSNFIREILDLHNESYISPNNLYIPYKNSNGFKTKKIKIDEDLIRSFNSNLVEKVSVLKSEYISNLFYEHTPLFYKEVLDSVKKINYLKLEFNKFYRNMKKQISYNEAGVKYEEELYVFINEKKKEVEMYFSTFENKIKTVVSKYNIASDDLDEIHASIQQVNIEIKNHNNQINDIEKKINNLIGTYEGKVIYLETSLNVKLKEIEERLYKSSEEKLLNYIEGADAANELMMSEYDEIKNTTKKFSEFMSDETSSKLTNHYKEKAEDEKFAYYGFTGLSVIIICVAFYISWNSLTDFAIAHIGTDKNYNSNDLIYLSIRLIFSLIVFSSVTFTSRLASKSYIYWKKNEGIFLRLTALKSFIADMSESKKEEIHEKLVDVYFGKDEQEQNMNQKLKDLPNNITQLLGKVVDQTSVVLDASKSKKDTQPPASSQSGG